ncbi:MAG: sigma-70 family RNA polymerase sigma factor [Bdellovibrionales bacterium]
MSVELDSSELILNIKKMIAKKVFRPEDQDDIVQNVMVKIVKYANLDEPGSFYAWLRMAVRSSIADYFRKTAQSEEYKEGIGNDDRQLYEEEIDKDLTACIYPFLKKMKKEEAELITRVDLEGKSQKKISENLGINYSTLKSRTTKARKNLGALISKCCPTGSTENSCC